MQKNNVRQATLDMAAALQKVFKKHSLNSRKIAWENLTDKEGRKEISKLIKNPDKQISTLRKLTFKEWINHKCITSFG